MTLQQLEYIVAVDKYKTFVLAAESCDVTQSTLSTLIQKLESELDVVIFDRNSRPVRPTLIGEKLIAQAKVVLYNVRQMEELVLTERKCEVGEIRLCITPTIAPYITPKLFKYLKDHHPDILIHASECLRDETIAKLQRAEIDVAIMSLPHPPDDLLEIPLYRENFYMYVSPKSPLFQQKEIDVQTMPREHLWGLKSNINLQLQAPQICDMELDHSSIYEASNIPTLMMIVDENGGFTTIPEMHLKLLRESYRENIRPIVNPKLYRNVSFFVRKDFVRERMLNILAEGIKTIIPQEMLNEHFLKYPIRL